LVVDEGVPTTGVPTTGDNVDEGSEDETVGAGAGGDILVAKKKKKKEVKKKEEDRTSCRRRRSHNTNVTTNCSYIYLIPQQSVSCWRGMRVQER